jgi:phosphoenolpyruvate synthase/pyruvate phosphate dikinase
MFTTGKNTDPEDCLHSMSSKTSPYHFITSLSDVTQSGLVGEKAFHLGSLLKKDNRVPNTYICTFQAYDQYKAGNPAIVDHLKTELHEILRKDIDYAVRSSANIEDLSGQSCAGQFSSYLNIRGLDNVVATIQKVWDSTESPRIQSYLKRFNKSAHQLQMAVIIQEMVHSKYSGVVFTRNPMNGRDEVIVEAVEGFGTLLMQTGVTPYRWIYKWGAWIEVPESTDMPLDLILQVVQDAKELEKEQGLPLNLEWAYDRQGLFWLQLRPIQAVTGLPIYSNKISREMLPGLIKPLVWSINIPLVCGAWIRLLQELLGDLGYRPEDLAKAFYYHAYFNMGVIGDIFEFFGPEKPRMKPRWSLKLLRLLPRISYFLLDKMFIAGRFKRFIKQHQTRTQQHPLDQISKLDAENTLRKLDELFEVNKEVAYFTLISQLLHSVYTWLLQRRLETHNIDIDDLDFPFTAYQDIIPNYALAKLNAEYQTLSPSTQQAMHTQSMDHLLSDPTIAPLMQHFTEFLEQFGHLSDQGNNFESVPWRETPSLILEMIRNYEITQDQISVKQDINALFSDFLNGILIKSLHRRVQAYREYKERISFQYTYCMGLFRPYYLHLGDLFTSQNILDSREEIFYLTRDEISSIINQRHMPDHIKQAYHQRKKEIARCHHIELPEIIYGDDVPEPLQRVSIRKELKGVAASSGYYRGPVKIVQGLTDFHKVRPGDVIVIPYSDISWAPLFSKAKAVVAEAGGLLSHSAIVAREYGIPAIVGVQNACHLDDHVEVLVDGYNGTLTVIDNG